MTLNQSYYYGYQSSGGSTFFWICVLIRTNQCSFWPNFGLLLQTLRVWWPYKLLASLKMKAHFNTILPYFSSNITLRSLYCNFKCSHMLGSSIVIQMNSIVYHLIIVNYSMKTLHWYFPWATALHLYNMTGTGGKLQQLHCYHPFSDSLDIYLTKNHYENYSPKMVPIAKIWGSGSWTITKKQ